MSIGSWLVIHTSDVNAKSIFQTTPDHQAKIVARAKFNHNLNEVQ